MANETGTYSISGRFTGADKIVASFLGIKDASDRTTQRIIANNQKASNSWQQHSKSMSGFVSGMHKMDRFLSGYQMMSVGSIFRHQVESFKPFIDEALKLSQAQSKFRAINLTEPENLRAFGAVAETVKNIKGLKLAEVTETMTDLHTATGDLSHALEGLAVASKFRFAFQTMFGDKFSPEQVEAAIQKGFKFLEITGVMQQGEKAVEEKFNAMVQMMSATGGRVTPDMLLLMAQRGGPATRSLSTAGLRNLAAPIQELGASRAGTSLMSLYQNLVGGKGVTQPAQAEYLRLGFLGKTAAEQRARMEFTKAGLPKRVKPGAFGAFALAMQEDPLKAADMLVQAMAKPMKGKPVEGAQLLVDAMRTGATVPAEKLRGVRQELAVLFGNRMANSLMDILVTQRPQILKESHLAETAKNIQQLYDQALDTPAGKIKQFENAVANLQATVGGPLLDAVTRAATGLMPYVKIMGEHPQVTLYALAVLKLGTALGQLTIAARMSGMTSLFGGTGAGAAGDAAAAGRGGRLATGLVRGFGVGLALFGLERVIVGAMDASEAEDAARKSGDRLGALLMLGIAEELEGKLPKAVLEANEKARAALIGKESAETLGLGRTKTAVGLFGQPSSMVTELARATGLGFSFDKGYGPVSKQFLFESGQGAEEKVRKQLSALPLNSLERFTTFLEEAKKQLASAGEPELYATLERLAKEAFPQFASSLEKSTQQVTAALGDFASTLRRLSSLGRFPLQPFPGFPLPSPKKQFGFEGGPFKLSSFTPPSYEPPVHLMPAMMQAARAGTGPIEITVNQTIGGGPVDAKDLERIKIATRQAVRESSREIRQGLDDRTRQREMMV